MATSTPNLARISGIAAELWRVFLFSKRWPAAIVDFVFRPPTKSTWRPKAMFKMLCRSDLYFRKILQFQFSEVWLKMPIWGPKWGFGDFTPKHFGLSSRPPKGTSLRENTHFDVQIIKISQPRRRGEETKKKNRKSQTVIATPATNF